MIFLVVYIVIFYIHVHDGNTQNISIFIQKIERFVKKKAIDPFSLVSYISFDRIRDKDQDRILTEIRNHISKNIKHISTDHIFARSVNSDIKEFRTENRKLLHHDFILFFICKYVQQNLCIHVSLMKVIPQENLLEVKEKFSNIPETEYESPHIGTLTTDVHNKLYQLKKVILSEIHNYTPVDCKAVEDNLQLQTLINMFFQNTTKENLLLFCPDEKRIRLYNYNNRKFVLVLNPRATHKKQQINIIMKK